MIDLMDQNRREEAPFLDSRSASVGARISLFTPTEKESMNSLKKAIELQLTQTNQQFNLIKNSLTEVVQLKEMLK